MNLLLKEKYPKIILLIFFVIWIIAILGIGISAIFGAWNLFMIIYRTFLFLGLTICVVSISIIFYLMIKEL
jgi:hypothetical protein